MFTLILRKTTEFNDHFNVNLIPFMMFGFVSPFSEGTIPEYAHGTYIYNGPGLSKIGDAEYKHAFDSAAMLQK